MTMVFPTNSRSSRKVHSKNKGTSLVLRYSVLSVLAVLFLLPFYLLLRNGLSTNSDIASPNWTFFPQTLHFENIQNLFSEPDVPFLDGLLNSALVATLQTGGQILVSILAGYALARIPYRWANVIFFAILLTLMIPAAVIYVPTYVIVSNLGWVNTLQGLVVPGLFTGFTTFLFRQFFLNFPRELEDAGKLDGLGYTGIFWHIVVPNSSHIIAAASIIAFINSWNAFIWPLVIGQDQSSWTIQVVLSNYLNAQVLNLPELFIGSLIAILPLMIIFLILQRYIAEGYRHSGLKG